MNGNFLIIGLVAALVELLRRIKTKDYFAVATIIGAGVIGGAVGFFHLYGVDVATGALLGLNASGLITIISSVKK